MNYATPTPAVFSPGATPVAQPAGFFSYNAQSFGQGLQQLGSALSNDAAGILDWGAGALGFSNPAAQAAAQAAISANPSIIDPTSPNYRGAYIGPAGTAPGIASEPGLLVGDIFSGSGVGKWILIGAAIWAAVELSRDG
jgi:hypothetical protein